MGLTRGHRGHLCPHPRQAGGVPDALSQMPERRPAVLEEGTVLTVSNSGPGTAATDRALALLRGLE